MVMLLLVQQLQLLLHSQLLLRQLIKLRLCGLELAELLGCCWLFCPGKQSAIHTLPAQNHFRKLPLNLIHLLQHFEVLRATVRFLLLLLLLVLELLLRQQSRELLHLHRRRCVVVDAAPCGHGVGLAQPFCSDDSSRSCNAGS